VCVRHFRSSLPFSTKYYSSVSHGFMVRILSLWIIFLYADITDGQRMSKRCLRTTHLCLSMGGVLPNISSEYPSFSYIFRSCFGGGLMYCDLLGSALCHAGPLGDMKAAVCGGSRDENNRILRHGNPATVPFRTRSPFRRPL
jgi:hypothetical protein